MAHRIEKRDTQQGRTQAWHGLTQIKEDLNLDSNWLTEWDVEEVPLYVHTESDPVEVPYKILVGTDDKQVIGKPFADSYRPISNKIFLEMIKDAISSVRGVTVESVGSVCNRGRVFVSLSLKDSSAYKIGNRQFNDFLNFGNAFDQSSVLWANNTNICTVCNNTFSYNLSNEDGPIDIRVFHKGNVEFKLTNMAEIIDAHLGSQAHYKAEFEKLMAIDMKPSEARELFAGWSLRASNDKELSTRGINKVNRLTELFSTGAGNSGENRADAFSAITDFFTHQSTRNNGANVGRQYVSSEFGLGKMAKTDFWNVIRNDDRVAQFQEIGAKALLNYS